MDSLLAAGQVPALALVYGVRVVVRTYGTCYGGWHLPPYYTERVTEIRLHTRPITCNGVW